MHLAWVVGGEGGDGIMGALQTQQQPPMLFVGLKIATQITMVGELNPDTNN